ncbi:hypothetical protein SteCoe_10230 [Stentor coeruleus]|uniref:FYVE-type domain-containing protein n=1 Tax=Stentor coeruleus TaxID=5963 RepID=A0A1R2CFW5_9CILI|nr:hypothetical protein SteCoe_10230 [Stentor coeruleus]
MGAKLPKDLLKAEKSKLDNFEGLFMRKIYDFNTFQTKDDDDAWEKVKIKIHQAKIECHQNHNIEIHNIDCDFLIFHQNHRNKELVLCLISEKKIWKIQALNLRQFLDTSTILMNSKIPTWSISPVCQLCSKAFSIAKRRHHCRNCGKNICKKCILVTDYGIEGFCKLTKVCKSCYILIDGQIGIIKNIERSCIGRKDESVKSFIPSSSGKQI